MFCCIHIVKKGSSHIKIDPKTSQCEFNRFKVIVEVTIVLASILSGFFFLAVFSSASLSQILAQIIPSFFSAEYNLIFVKEIGGINVNIVVIYLIVLSSAALLVFRSLKGSKEKPVLRQPISACIFSSLIIFILIAGIQAINYTKYFLDQQGFLSHKSIEQKYSLIFGDLYDYAVFAKNVCPAGSQARLLMDELDPTTGLHDHIVLAYHLWPLEIQLHPTQVWGNQQAVKPDRNSPECLLIFRKADPLKKVLPGYHVQKIFNSSSLVAVKDGS